MYALSGSGLVRIIVFISVIDNSKHFLNQLTNDLQLLVLATAQVSLSPKTEL